MHQELQLKTGDVSVARVEPWQLTIAFDEPCAEIRIQMDDAVGVIIRDQWEMLIEQVKRREPSRWQYSDYPPPLGDELKGVVAKLNTTAAYQLFLAGFECAQLLGLISHDWDSIFRLGPVISDLYTGGGKRGGLYFPPDEWFERQSEEVIDELLRNNKIGRLTATSNNGSQLDNVYIPYATPATLPRDLSPDAKHAWDKLRALYDRSIGRE